MLFIYMFACVGDEVIYMPVKWLVIPFFRVNDYWFLFVYFLIKMTLDFHIDSLVVHVFMLSVQLCCTVAFGHLSLLHFGLFAMKIALALENIYFSLIWLLCAKIYINEQVRLMSVNISSEFNHQRWQIISFSFMQDDHEWKAFFCISWVGYLCGYWLGN